MKFVFVLLLVIISVSPAQSIGTCCIRGGNDADPSRQYAVRSDSELMDDPTLWRSDNEPKGYAQNNPSQDFLKEVRLAFYDLKSDEKIKKFIAKIDSGIPSIEASGYRAVAVMKRAKYAFWPLSKLAYFREGKANLEKLIRLNPDNIELRFQRILVQTQIPSFLGYSSDIDTDMKTLLANTGDIEEEFKHKLFMALKSIDSLQTYFE